MKRTALVSLLLLGLSACYDAKDYTPTESLSRGIVSLATVNGVGSMPADGVSRLTVVALLSAEAAAANRTVVFTTTAGKLIGGTGSGDLRREVPAASDGRALVDLQAGTQVESAVVRAQIQSADGVVPGVAAELQIAFTAPGPDDVIRFVTAPAEAPADGASTTLFRVAVATGLAGQTVHFTTTQGTFAGTASAPTVDSPVLADSTASASLVSPLILVDATVTASINGQAREAQVRFTRALPQQLVVTTDATTVSAAAGTKVTVTVRMIRDRGTVTPGTTATFTAASGGVAAGSFQSIGVSDSTGTLTADWFPGTTTPVGPVTITVRAEGGATASVVVQVTT